MTDNIDNPKMLPILEFISDVAHKLQIATVAEGAEEERQLEFVKKYHFKQVIILPILEVDKNEYRALFNRIY